MTSPTQPGRPGKPGPRVKPGSPNPGNKDAKRVAAVVLDVLAGVRTPTQAAGTLSVSLPRYYQLEARALDGLIAACEPRPKGRQVDPSSEVARLRREAERLRRDLARQQALVRMTQRTVGVGPPAPPPMAAGRKRKPRKATVRATRRAAQLRAEVGSPGEDGVRDTPVSSGS